MLVTIHKFGAPTCFQFRNVQIYVGFCKSRVVYAVLEAIYQTLTASPFQGSEKYFGIKGRRPVVDVVQIQIHPLIKTHIVPLGADLPDACDARLHGEAASLPNFLT